MHGYTHHWHPRGYWRGYYAPRYYGYYPSYGYYPYYDPGAAVAAGIIGSVFGAIASTALSHSTHHHRR